MANLAGVIPPVSIGFVANPNLILPLYVRYEVVTITDVDGNDWNLRRPRPLSILAGAHLLLQSDRELFAR